MHHHDYIIDVILGVLKVLPIRWWAISDSVYIMCFGSTYAI